MLTQGIDSRVSGLSAEPASELVETLHDSSTAEKFLRPGSIVITEVIPHGLNVRG